MSAKYHPEEIEVQERAGVRSMAERVGNSIHSTIPPTAREGLQEQEYVREHLDVVNAWLCEREAEN